MSKTESTSRRLLKNPFKRESEASQRAERQPRKARSPWYLAGLLGAFSVVGAALLGSGFAATEEAVQNRQREDLLSSLSLVIPPAMHDNDIVADSFVLALGDGRTLTVYPAREKAVIQAVAYEVTGQGYGGAIRILMGIGADGTILGVRVLQHAETPGLGDRVEAAKSDWIEAFSGTSLTNVSASGWAVRKDGGRFDQFSGATITPRAVVKAVHEGLEFFQIHRDALTAMPMENQS
ncbi:electron transport complex subunit RsxG [Martelella endophytica]|uniref:Ion-translocating oxidoreductase complex subunit G n=1 Tax=Martelella endophytica TaxID=1486262 RepID=A0A0D5LTT4_MAREN|nr:electron transport complex subunit RsxG [Martelella endophytica]AJY46788.1 hypothetical protein TM49_15715 [Martelella endophytica]